MEIVVYLAILLLGVSVGFTIKTLLVRRREYSGVMYVTANEEKVLYSLELEDYPELLQFKKHVVFKVETTQEIPDRE